MPQFLQRRAALLFAGLATAVLSPAPAAHAFPGPFADVPAPIGPTSAGGFPRTLVLLVGPDGETVVATRSHAGSIQTPIVATRGSGTDAYAITTGPSAGNVTPAEMRAAIGADGTLAALIPSSTGPRLGVRRPGASLTTPVLLRQAGQLTSALERLAVGVTPTGRVLALRTATTNSGATNELVTIAGDGSVEARFPLSTEGGFDGGNGLTVLPDGTALVASGDTAAANRLLMFELAPGASSLTPRPSVSTTAPPSQVYLTSTTDGRALAAWTDSNAQTIVEATVRRADGSVADPVTLNADAVSQSVDVRTRADGTAAITYLAGGTLWQATLTGATLSTPTALLTNTFGATDARVDTSPTGLTVAALATSTGVVTVNLSGGRIWAPMQITTDGLIEAARFAPDGSYTLITRPSNSNVAPNVYTYGAPPLLTAQPSLSGVGTVGAPLTCAPGSWRGAPTAPAISWLRGGTPVGSGSTYVLSTADAGAVVSCQVVASNAFGTTGASSAGLAVAAAALPRIANPPRLTGRARVGKTLRCVAGAPASGVTQRIAWLRGSKVVKGATGKQRKLTRADRGRVVSCRVTATSSAGSTSALSVGVLVR